MVCLDMRSFPSLSGRYSRAIIAYLGGTRLDDHLTFFATSSNHRPRESSMFLPAT